MIEKIIKVISDLKVLSKMNEIIDGLNTHTTNTNNPHNVTAEQLGLATAYVYKGSVTNFSDLPTNAQNGWVYSVENEHTDSAGILHPAGANFAWNGSQWDDLGGSLSGYAKSVNSQTPDSKGNVFLNLVESLEKNTEDKLLVHNADGTTQEIELVKNNDNDLNNILDSITELENRVTPIEKGGTGATTANDACNNLGLSWDYLHRYGVNFVPSDTRNYGWNKLGIFSVYYNEANKIKNQPTHYGQLLNIPADKGVESTQIWIEQAAGRIYFRGGNALSVLEDTPFKKVVTTADNVAFMPNYGSYVQISTGNYTPTSNGIIIVNHTHNGDYQTVKVVHKSSGLEIFRDAQTRYPGDFTSWCLVTKSETYAISVSGGSSTVYFCPMKEK